MFNLYCTYLQKEARRAKRGFVVQHSFDSLLTNGEQDKQVMWSRVLGRLIHLAMPDAPDALSVALRHVCSRLPPVQASVEAFKV